MKKYLLSFCLIIVFTFYVLLENQNSISVVSNSPDKNGGTTNTGNGATPPAVTQNNATTSAPSATGTQSVSTAPTPTVAGLYRDGSYNGDSVDAYFGNVQVAAVVSGEKLTDIKILTYPKDRTTSARINNAAFPTLIKEAISSQSAQVDVVSGATETSQGFQRSLASALAKAKN
jgi:uncharacterized protein with FMN-binding domain